MVCAESPCGTLPSSSAITYISRAVSSWWSTHWRQSSPSEVNFLIFAPSWTILALVPLVVLPLRFSHLTTSTAAKYGILALEMLTMLFWFGGFIALAVFLSDRICFGTVCLIILSSKMMSSKNADMVSFRSATSRAQAQPSAHSTGLHGRLHSCTASSVW